MKQLILKFEHFEYDKDIYNANITLVEDLYFDEVKASSLLGIEIKDSIDTQSIIVKFEWLDSLYKLSEDFCFIPEANTLFFRSIYQWGVIDVENKKLTRHESAFNCPSITRYNNLILITDELYAESVTLTGERIDNVPIDPPYELQEFEDRIEYTSHVYGHQILKLR